jgi:hypothetical protein
MSAVIRIRGWSKFAAAETGTAKANAATAAPDSTCNGLGSQSATTKTASTNATAAETTTETSSVETAATTAAGPCRLTKHNDSSAY